jgi:nucleotide-binding universal stress UspA family protein
MEKNVKNILVHYDSQDMLPSVVDVAVVLSTMFNSSLTFAHVGEKTNNYDEYKNTLESLLKQKNLPAETQIKFLKKEGKSYVEIVNIAKEINADSIIIKNEHSKGLHFFDDNTPFDAVMAAPCPVITLSKNVRLDNIKNIILPIDHTLETRQKIPMAINLAKHFDATIHIVAVGENKSGELKVKLDHYAEQSKKYIEEKGVKYTFTTIIGNDICTSVINYAQQVNGDIILITADGASNGIFSQPYAAQIINKSPIPVMSLQAKDLKVSYAAL